MVCLYLYCIIRYINYTNRFGTGIYTLHLQIDAVVNQGNSGGRVMTTDGKVAGIIVSILSPQEAFRLGWCRSSIDF